MNNEQNWKNIGEQIKQSVSESISTGDYNRISQLVTDTVNSALREVKNQAEQAKDQVVRQMFWENGQAGTSQTAWQNGQAGTSQTAWQNGQAGTSQAAWQNSQANSTQTAWQNGPVNASQAAWQNSLRRQEAKKAERELRKLVKIRKIGKVSGILYMVFGGIGLGLSVMGMVTLSILGLLGVVGFQWSFAVLLLGCFFGGMIKVGSDQSDRLKRAERYIQLCGNKMYGMLEDIARQTGKSLRFVQKDVNKMLKIGMFPEGHLDEKQTCFMLTDSIFDQYTQTEAAYRERLEAQKQSQEALESAKGAQEEGKPQENELNAMVAEGMECIRKLRDLNDRIEDEKISRDLFTLENLLKEIFDCIREHPEQMHRMQKLMDYYLPTTVKLVEAYDEFNQVSVPGADILAAKTEIEKTLGVINGAFAELLNALYQDAALDVTTDAQVLQTMLAKEGLTREPAFVRRENNSRTEEMRYEQ